jgi:hypothetical protein
MAIDPEPYNRKMLRFSQRLTWRALTVSAVLANGCASEQFLPGPRAPNPTGCFLEGDVCSMTLQMIDETRPPAGDRLLTVAQTAERLACTKDWLYRHHHRLPFAVHNGRQLRFSAHGLDRHIRRHAGRETPSVSGEREP